VHRDAANADVSPSEAAEALAAALALARGRPYTELPWIGYGWVATELLISETQAAITGAASRLAELATSHQDWVLASWAAEKGLIVDPSSEDLNTAMLRSAAAEGNPTGSPKRGATWSAATQPSTKTPSSAHRGERPAETGPVICHRPRPSLQR